MTNGKIKRSEGGGAKRRGLTHIFQNGVVDEDRHAKGVERCEMAGNTQKRGCRVRDRRLLHTANSSKMTSLSGIIYDKGNDR